MKPTQTELPALADYRDEVCFVDQFADAESRLRLDGFTITALEPQIGRGTYRLHATRVTRPGPDLDIQPKAPCRL